MKAPVCPRGVCQVGHLGPELLRRIPVDLEIVRAAEHVVVHPGRARPSCIDARGNLLSLRHRSSVECLRHTFWHKPPARRAALLRAGAWPAASPAIRDPVTVQPVSDDSQAADDNQPRSEHDNDAFAHVRRPPMWFSETARCRAGRPAPSPPRDKQALTGEGRMKVPCRPREGNARCAGSGGAEFGFTSFSHRVHGHAISRSLHFVSTFAARMPDRRNAKRSGGSRTSGQPTKMAAAFGSVAAPGPHLVRMLRGFIRARRCG